MHYAAKLLGLVGVTAVVVPATQMLEFVGASPYLMPPAMAQGESAAARKAEADRLLQQGRQQYNVSQFREVLQLCEQALAIYREIDVREAFPEESRAGEGKALVGLGVAYSSLGQYTRAIDYFEQGLAIAHEIHNRTGEVDALGNLGGAYLRLGRYPQAIDYFKQSLMVAREIGYRAGEGIALGNLGNAYLSLGQYPQAINYHEQGLTIARDIGDRAGEGIALGNSGNAYLSLGQYPQAINYHEQSLAIAREIGNRAGEGIVFGNLGNAYLSLGQYLQAVNYYEQSLAIASAIADLAGEGNALGSLGDAYLRLGQYPQAINYHEQHLTIARDIGDRAGEGNALGSLGNAYLRLGDIAQAINYCEQSLTIAREIGDRNGEGNALGNMGSAYLRLGQYPQAINYYEQHLTVAREIGNRAGESTALGDLGDAYLRLGQYPEAINYHKQSLDIALEVGARDREGSALWNLGNVYLMLRQYPQAIDYYEQSLAISRQTGNRAGESYVLTTLGGAYVRLEQYPEAINYLEQSLAITREIGEPNGEGSALGNLGLAHNSLGQYSQAIDYYEQSLAIFRKIGDRAGEGAKLGDLGLLFADQDQPELAIIFLKASVQVREAIRGDNRSLDSALQQSYTDTVVGTYRTLADLLIAKGEILEAQRVLELLKVQELQDFTRSRVTNLETRDYELDPAEKTVIDAHSSLVAFGLKRSECEASPDCTDATLADLDTQYEQLSAAYNQAVSQLTTQRRDEQEARARRADGQLLQARQELSPEGFAGTAGVLTRNHPGTVLAYPVVLDDKLWVLWGSAGGVVSAIEVPAGRQRIGDAVLRFRRLMTACERGGCDARDIPAVQAVAQELYQYLIPAPLEEELQALQATLPEGQVPNLVIVPDLVTRYIPFAALHDGQQYLIEKYAISTLLGAEQTTTDNPLTSIDSTSILGLGLSNPVPEHGFPFPLENVPVELGAIVQTSATEPGIFRGETHLNETFDSEKLRLARRHQVLHLATHGVFDPKADSLSFLMLGVGQPLYIHELQKNQDYFQNLSLVVLSACETALSDIDQSGLELASIASTFLQARVDTVVASLWKVNDSATSDLMRQFYGSLAQSTPEQRISVSQALRQAQLAMLYGNEAADATARASIAIEGTGPRTGASDLPRTAHPYYWSPFTIIGNGL